MSEADIGEGETKDPQVASSFGNLPQVTQRVAASDLNALSVTSFAWELPRQKTEKGGYPTTAVGWWSVSPEQEANVVLWTSLPWAGLGHVLPTHQALIHPPWHPFPPATGLCCRCLGDPFLKRCFFKILGGASRHVLFIFEQPPIID